MKVADSPISKSFSSLSKSQVQKHQTVQKEAGLEVGKLLKARVVNVKSGGRVLLEASGREFSARSLVNLQQGEELWLEVKEAGSAPLLTLAAKKGAVYDFIKVFFANLSGRQGALSDFLSQFLSLQTTLTAGDKAALEQLFLHATSSAVDDVPDPEIVKLMALLHGALQHPGGKGDASLVDRLMTVMQPGLRLKTAGVEIFQKTIDDLTKTIEVHQQVNSKILSENEPVFFLFPCFFEGKEGWGEWMYSSESSSTSDQGFTLDFYLEMSRLESISIHLVCKENGLSGEFRTSKEGIRDHVNNNLPELQEILENIGYHPVSLTCRQSDHNNPQELQKKISSQAGLHRFALIDVRT